MKMYSFPAGQPKPTSGLRPAAAHHESYGPSVPTVLRLHNSASFCFPHFPPYPFSDLNRHRTVRENRLVPRTGKKLFTVMKVWIRNLYSRGTPLLTIGFGWISKAL